MDICKGTTEMNGHSHKKCLGKAMSISCVLNILKRKAWGGTSEIVPPLEKEIRAVRVTYTVSQV